MDYHFSFDSLSAFALQARDGEVQAKHRCESIDGSYDFTATFDFDEAVSMALEGWKAQREAFTTPINLADVEGAQFSTTFDVTGSYVDVGRFLTGEPECMVSPVVVAHKPIVRIAMNLAISAFTQTEDIIRCGAITLGLIDHLTAHGYGVEVIGYYRIESVDHERRHSSTTAITIKRSDAPLDIDAMAFLVAHPSAFRRLGFRLMEQQGTKYRKRFGVADQGSGYGLVDRTWKPECDLWLGMMNDPKRVRETADAYLTAGA